MYVQVCTSNGCDVIIFLLRGGGGGGGGLSIGIASPG